MKTADQSTKPILFQGWQIIQFIAAVTYLQPACVMLRCDFSLVVLRCCNRTYTPKEGLGKVLVFAVLAEATFGSFAGGNCVESATLLEATFAPRPLSE